VAIDTGRTACARRSRRSRCRMGAGARGFAAPRRGRVRDGTVSVDPHRQGGGRGLRAGAAGGRGRRSRALPGVSRALVALTAERTPTPTACRRLARPRDCRAETARGRWPRSTTSSPWRAARAAWASRRPPATSRWRCGAGAAGRAARRGHLRPVGAAALRAARRPRVREGRLLEPMDGYGVKVMSIGFVVDEEAAMIWRGPMVQSAITQLLGEVAWGRSTCSWSTCRRDRRRAARAGAGGTARRGGDRLDAAGPRADRRAAGDRDVREGRRADPRPRGEHGRLRLPDLRQRSPDLRDRAARGPRRSGSACPSSARCRFRWRCARPRMPGRPVAACEPESETGRLYSDRMHGRRAASGCRSCRSRKGSPGAHNTPAALSCRSAASPCRRRAGAMPPDRGGSGEGVGHPALEQEARDRAPSRRAERRVASR
jgi:hypothetical protein